MWVNEGEVSSYWLYRACLFPRGLRPGFGGFGGFGGGFGGAGVFVFLWSYTHFNEPSGGGCIFRQSNKGGLYFCCCCGVSIF